MIFGVCFQGMNDAKKRTMLNHRHVGLIHLLAINQTEPITLSLTQPNAMYEEAHHQVEKKHAQGVGEEDTRHDEGVCTA